MQIRLAVAADFEQIWPFFKEIAAAGETYAYPRDLTQQEAAALWMSAPRETYVVEQQGQLVGSYYLKTNQAGPGSHVCNAGYMVAEAARGQGVAAAMCAHSLERARALGYLAMQFNLVVSTNQGAIALWQKMGFEVVGRLPRAFAHPTAGYVDALVMYQWLESSSSGEAP
ncbi:GNAT family N-acetyltransferase [Marinospirillum sp.]|uniref:GNAT family N-acetyltransferase n=1 Tax=Marinospirillum sp. TaxID=2183934 RepID=UPI003A8AF683